MKWKEWFHFSARERAGMLVLLILIPLIYTAPVWLKKILDHPPADNTPQVLSVVEKIREEQVAVLQKKDVQFPVMKDERYYPAGNSSRYRPFYAYSKQGYHSSYAATSRGKTVPGFMTVQRYNSYTSRDHSANTRDSYTYQNRNQYAFSPKDNDYPGRYSRDFNAPSASRAKSMKEVLPGSIDINLASREDWQQLPGIGPVLSARIVTFREKMGGFQSIQQVASTYGLPDSVFNQIKSLLKENTQVIRKLSINSCSEEELAAHPAIRWKLAKQLVNFRKEHGPLNSAEDLNGMMFLDSAMRKTIAAYCSFSKE